MGRSIQKRASSWLLVTALAMGSLVVLAAPAQAAVAFEAVEEADNAGGANTLVINRPAAAGAGDFLVAHIVIESGTGGTITTPVNAGTNNWTLADRTNNGGDVGSAVYYKFATGSEPSSYTFTLNSKKAVGAVMSYTGVHTTDPIDDEASAPACPEGASGGSSNTPTAPTCNTSSANDLLLTTYGIKLSTTFTAPGGMTERYQDNSTGGFSGAAYDQQLGAAGATGTRAATTASSEKWVGQNIAIRAAPAANTCTKSGSALNITMNQGGTLTVNRSGSNFSVTATDITDSTCGGATVNNIDTVNVTGGSANDTVIIDLSNGQFEPSAGAGDTETAEIEFAIDLAGGTGDKVTVQGGSGNDTLDATASGIKLNTDSDVDVTNTNVESVELKGGGGADTLKGSTNAESLTGEDGDDFIVGGGGADTINAGNGDDFATGGGSGDTINGDAGNDSLLGRAGSDDINGGADNDSLSPGGTAANDAIDGGSGRDVADYGRSPAAGTTGVSVDLAIVGDGSVGGSGDQNTGPAGSDDVKDMEAIRGSFYNDVLKGDSQDNFLFGWGGDDELQGLDGNDGLSGGAGNDLLLGGEGQDQFHGGDGTDTCDGGNGVDDFGSDEGTCETEQNAP